MPDSETLDYEAQLRRCQRECKARCCRYITVHLPAPRRRADYDEIIWFLSHEHISVYFESRRWHLEVRTPCRYLTRGNLCAIYENRPAVCRDYDLDACEYPERPQHQLQFDTREQFEQWWAEKRERERRRRRRRAQHARRAQERSRR